MSGGFFTRLAERATEVDSLLCVGLDPRAGDAIEARDQCLALIGATAHAAAAFKANSAFFEMHGQAGIEALAEVIAAVPDGIPVILDAKRGDISSTAAAYAVAVYETLGADAVTLSPYLGLDSIDPFLAHRDRGVFVLCRTSNPGGGHMQERRSGGEPLYVAVARDVAGLPEEQAGLVIGATVPDAMAVVRSVASEHWILAPGVGAQGGSLEAAIAAGRRDDGLGVLLPVSRSISESSDPGAAVDELNQAVRAARSAERSPVVTRRLANDLFETGCVRFGDFTLKSGRRSPVYLDLRSLVGHPAVLQRTARRYADLLPRDGIRIAGVPLAGLPIATAVAIESEIPLAYPRPTVKEHGTRSPVEGPYSEGDEVVIVDDVATSGISITEAASVLRSAGLIVHSAVVLVDRGGGAEKALADIGIELRSVTTLLDLVEDLVAEERVPAERLTEVRDFLASD